MNGFLQFLCTFFLRNTLFGAGWGLYRGFFPYGFGVCPFPLLLFCLLGVYGLLSLGAAEVSSAAPSAGVGPAMLSGLLSNLIPLAVVFVEIVGAAGLVWGAIWRLERE